MTTAERGPRRSFASTLQAAWLGRGPLASALVPVAALYGAVTALRRLGYRQGWIRSERLPVPVVVVGNLVAGGAGKTPTVIALVDLLRDGGHTPGVVSRGHGRDGRATQPVRRDTPARAAGDEPRLIPRRTGAPGDVGADRPAAARALLRRAPEVDIIVSDDGLQHLRLARSAQVLVFDDRGAGNGWLLPAGPLREPLPRQLPARSVVLYNAPRQTTPLAGHLAHRALAGAVELGAWWAGAPASLDTLHALRGRPLVAAAGLARPRRFFDMLIAEGLTLTPLPLSDHHRFDALPWPPGTPDVVVTEKDAVKLDALRVAPSRVWVVTLDFRLDDGFRAAFAALLPHPPPTAPPHGSPPA